MRRRNSEVAIFCRQAHTCVSFISWLWRRLIDIKLHTYPLSLSTDNSTKPAERRRERWYPLNIEHWWITALCKVQSINQSNKQPIPDKLGSLSVRVRDYDDTRVLLRQTRVAWAVHTRRRCSIYVRIIDVGWS